MTDYTASGKESQWLHDRVSCRLSVCSCILTRFQSSVFIALVWELERALIEAAVGRSEDVGVSVYHFFTVELHGRTWKIISGA